MKKEELAVQLGGPEKALVEILSSNEGMSALRRTLRGSVRQAGSLIEIAGEPLKMGLPLDELVEPMTVAALEQLAVGTVEKTTLLQWGLGLGNDLIMPPREGVDETLVENWINWSVIEGYQMTEFAGLGSEARNLFQLPEKLRFVKGWDEFAQMTLAVKPLVEMSRRGALALPDLVADLCQARLIYNARFGEIALVKQRVMGMLARLDAARQLVGKETDEVNALMVQIADRLRHFSLNSSGTGEMTEALNLLDQAARLSDRVSRAAGETLQIPPIIVMATERAMNNLANLPTEQTVVGIFADRVAAALMVHQIGQVATSRVVDGLVRLLHDYQRTQLSQLTDGLMEASKRRFLDNMNDLSAQLPAVAGSYVGVGRLAALTEAE